MRIISSFKMLLWKCELIWIENAINDYFVVGFIILMLRCLCIVEMTMIQWGELFWCYKALKEDWCILLFWSFYLLFKRRSNNLILDAMFILIVNNLITILIKWYELLMRWWCVCEVILMFGIAPKCWKG